MSRGADLPATMACVEIGEPGGPEALQTAERPVPSPAEGEVLIRVAAAGVNRPDVLQRKGNYPPPPDLPGLEIAGEIVALGKSVGQEMLGQPVCALVAGGGYAEYCTAPVGQCLTIPDGVTMAEAAALPETLFTVWHNVFERGYAAQGETLLVHGGTSGIGTMAIKLAKLFGITVYVTCGSDEKCQAAEKVGADAAINYKSQDFVDEVKKLTDGKGVNVVLDMVGGDYVPRNIQCLADDGRHVSIAFQRGMSAEISIVQIMQRRLVLTGSTLRARDIGFKTLLADEIANNVWPFVGEGKLKAEIDRLFPLAEAAAAHAHMEAGDHIGKIILEI